MLLLRPITRAFSSLSLSCSLHTHAEKTFIASDGLSLSYQQYKAPTSENQASPILCLHGWTDNSASFDALVPFLSASNPSSDIFLLDFPGHGLSSHKSPDAPHILSDYVFYATELLTTTINSPVHLIGHSMGAGVGSVLAAVYPEHIKTLAMIEGAGPLSRPATSTTGHIRKNIDKRLSSNKTLFGTETCQRLYPDRASAIATRMKTAELMPGAQYISEQAAARIVDRGTSTSSDGKVAFTHDKRLTWPSLAYLDEEGVIALMKSISCPVTIIKADYGWPVTSPANGGTEDRERRLAALKDVTVVETKGSHHCHADAETVEEVAKAINDSLLQR